MEIKIEDERITKDNIAMIYTSLSYEKEINKNMKEVVKKAMLDVVDFEFKGITKSNCRKLIDYEDYSGWPVIKITWSFYVCDQNKHELINDFKNKLDETFGLID
ncbi:hypothetical protein [Methanobacterium sp.]|uniref:hypothetical protein n=1 Tax=Methanobacterium sp. TaxID=2164 RepID=UPI003C750906